MAEHSVLVSRIVPKKPKNLPILALLHDASEAYLGDVIRPLKQQLNGEYHGLEVKWQAAILERFGFLGKVNKDIENEIKDADLVALYAEAKDLLAPGLVADWREVVPKHLQVDLRHFNMKHCSIEGYTPPEAKDLFLERLLELT